MLIARYHWSPSDVEPLTAEDILFWDKVVAAGERRKKTRETYGC